MGFQSEEESGESNRKHQMGSELPPLPAAPGAKLSHPTAEEPMGEGRAVKQQARTQAGLEPKLTESAEK